MRSYSKQTRFIGEYEMRLMDKLRTEAGFVTHAKVRWYGIGSYAYPYLWKTNKSDTDYQESWDDPRIPKTQKVEKEEESDLSKSLKKTEEGKDKVVVFLM